MARKDKKNRTCNRCGYTCSTPQMLRAHLNRKNPCRPRVIPTTNPIQVSDPIPETNQQHIPTHLNDMNSGRFAPAPYPATNSFLTSPMSVDRRTVNTNIPLVFL